MGHPVRAGWCSARDKIRMTQMSATTVNLGSLADIVEARRKGYQVARKIGFSAMDSTVIATVISELAHTLVGHPHATVNVALTEHGRDRGIEVMMACDADGVKAAPLGGPFIERTRPLVDELHILDDPLRTAITLKKFLPKPRGRRLRLVVSPG